MKKKIILTLFAFIIFFMPVQNGIFPNQADAFISKLMGLSAKKIAKEVVKDIAVESAANFAVNEAFKIAEAQMAKYNQQEAYKIVCLSRMTGEVCDKPIAVKENLSEADKISIAHQAELELDKLVSPDGKGFTKWQKFLDWFGPVWVTGAIMTALTYALDGGVRDLFNEAGYNALVALGFIKPVHENVGSSPSDFVDETGNPIGKETVTNQTNPPMTYTNQQTSTTNPFVYSWKPMSVPIKDTLILTQFNNQNNTKINKHFVAVVFDNSNRVQLLNNFTRGGNLTYMAEFFTPQSEVWATVDGQKITTTTIEQTGAGKLAYVPKSLFSDNDKIHAIMTRLPYEKDGYLYTDHLMYTTSGLIYGIHGKSQMTLPKNTFVELYAQIDSSTPYGQNAIKQSIFTNTATTSVIPYNPEYDPSIPDNDLMENSSSIDKYDRVTLIPPVGIPYNDSVSGEPLKISPNPSPGGEPIFTKPDGTVVPEENVTVGDPNTTPSPDGSPQVTPQPTPSNPTPEPISLNPPNTAPPIETETPVFPEGESCSVGLKLPKISPLAYAVSEAFPFSIPFDLYDGFQAIFSEMGNEKPEFNYKLDFMGEQQEWKISIPDYFDSWKKFTDSFIIFIFDVGIIFMIFRFMGGSK